MGTSATYKIGKNTFYTNYDGYEEGAANRLLNAVKALTKPDKDALEKIADVRGGFSFALIRGNADVEPDAGIEGEYNYNIKESYDGITVNKIDLAEFISSYATINSSSDEVLKIEIPSAFSDRVRVVYATKADAFEIGILLRDHSESFDDNNPNKKKYAKDSKVFLDAVL